MLRIVNLEELDQTLLQVPEMVNRLDRRDPQFVPHVKQWLVKLEEVLTNNRMPVTAQVGALRGVLTATERGAMPPGVGFYGRTTPRKIRDTVAVNVLRQSNELVSSAVHQDRERIAEAERLGRRLVALAKLKGIIYARPGKTHTEVLKAVWRDMCEDPDIRPGTVNLLGLVGPYDALIVIDRAIAADVPVEGAERQDLLRFLGLKRA